MVNKRSCWPRSFRSSEEDCNPESMRLCIHIPSWGCLANHVDCLLPLPCVCSSYPSRPPQRHQVRRRRLLGAIETISPHQILTTIKKTILIYIEIRFAHLLFVPPPLAGPMHKIAFVASLREARTFVFFMYTFF